MMRSAGERFAAHEKLHVFPREDVVRDDAKLVVAAHPLAERVDERRFPGSDRATDAEPHRAVSAHDRNSRDATYC